MGDTVTAIIAIGLAAALMFLYPTMTMSNRADDISQQVIETEVTDLVNKVRTTAKFTEEDYEKFIESISATGVAYDPEIEWASIDENPGKKVTQTDYTKIGENRYVTRYTSEILDTLGEDATNHQIILKEGDIFTVRLKNSGTTISQQLSGSRGTIIAAEDSGIVTTDGD